MALKALKKPKGPKGGLHKASLKQILAYEKRVNAYAAKVSARQKDATTKANTIKKIEALVKKHIK